MVEVHGEFDEDCLRTLRIRRLLTGVGSVLFDVDQGHDDPRVEVAIGEVNSEYWTCLLDLTGDTHVGASTIEPA